jgi:hypothetical protein
MGDLLFDPITREMVITDGDFTYTDNPSVQNAAVILYARGFNLYQPTIGIGIGDIINSHPEKAVFAMNRWKKQMVNDGATKANYKITIDENNTVTIKTDVSYL